MSTKSGISVALLSCDRPSWCEVALRSVLVQTHTDFEVVVRDDSTGPEVKALIESIDDHRVRYVRGERIGQLANFVGAVQETAGDVVLVLHDDDWWAPTLLEKLAVPMLADPAIDFATAPFSYVDADGAALDDMTRLRERTAVGHVRAGIVELSSVEDRARELVIRRLVSPFQGTAIRRRVLEHMDMPAGAGTVLDLWLSAHLAKTTKTWLFVAEHLVSYRIHGSSVASAMSDIESQRWVMEGFLGDPELAPIHREIRDALRDFQRREALARIVLGERNRARSELHAIRGEYGWRTRFVNVLVTRRPASDLVTRWLRRRSPRYAASSERTQARIDVQQ
jgi:glycosyltransferase involved in cell wall biosynthesis